MAERINLIPERCQYKDKQVNRPTNRQKEDSPCNLIGILRLLEVFFINLCQKKDFSSLCLTTAQKVSEKSFFYLCLVMKY